MFFIRTSKKKVKALGRCINELSVRHITSATEKNLVGKGNWYLLIVQILLTELMDIIRIFFSVRRARRITRKSRT